MIFDTTFLIDLEREYSRDRPGGARAFLQLHQDTPLSISIITVYEFAEGFLPAQEQACRHALSRYNILQLTTEIAWKAGQISRQLRTSGQRLGDNDILIAATALRHRLPLVTKNLRHFERIPGLSLTAY
ncbi:MAG: type II toxin-antitoxin system VapC family toxin [Acidobacteriota bacterium]